MTTSLPVHPFPARMAPELALGRLPRRLDGGLTVLDPMMGSGTIPITAALQGYRAIGFDSDPLAVIIARTTGRSLDGDALEAATTQVVELARSTKREQHRHADDETQEFIDRWFDRTAQLRLGALARAIQDAPPLLQDPLWCAFSRLIITKDAGASRARDVSHSRPHVVRAEASFDPIERFAAASEAVSHRHRLVSRTRPGGDRLRLSNGDARALPLADDSVDAVMTSPPYLQAIDYLRGHRMSLVWMGHTIGELRALRSGSIGTERGMRPDDWTAEVVREATPSALPERPQRIVARYVDDVLGVMREMRRVVRPNGTVTFVVANSTAAGVAVSICRITEACATRSGFVCSERTERSIPTRSRYLPPPIEGGANSLDRRMKVEHCLTFH